jgi:hypothetical protein
MNITTNLGKLQCLRTAVRKSYVSESEEVARMRKEMRNFAVGG